MSAFVVSADVGELLLREAGIAPAPWAGGSEAFEGDSGDSRACRFVFSPTTLVPTVDGAPPCQVHIQRGEEVDLSGASAPQVSGPIIVLATADGAAELSTDGARDLVALLVRLADEADGVAR